ncbi:MAG: response regulator [Candidatus Alcyoniella australis]|nr:response regulator [Candidatus Alcyoniella australis]
MTDTEHKTEQPSAARPKIMVVDDDRTVRDLLQRELAKHGLDVFTVANGLKLVSVLKVNKPDLILLDIMMSWIDGFELCKIVKGVSEFQHIPVIFISHRNLPEDVEFGYACGASDYISKPFEINDLIARVKKALTAASSQSE